MNWWKDLEGKINPGEPLSKHTTFKIGGRAKFFIEPRDAASLKTTLVLLKKYKIPFFVIGGGSNILVSDEGVDAAVLHLGAPYFKKMSFRGNCLEIGAGIFLKDAVRASRDYGLSGLEFLIGIPGTLGGALIMNAGVAKSRTAIGDLVESVTVMDRNGKALVLNKRDIKFEYRNSSLKKYIILNACLKLFPKDKDKINDTIKEYISYRRYTQDLSWPSAGCIFKNPNGYSAGKLIEMCGLKGARVGDAYVSEKHANFILNKGKAKARDVLKLIAIIKKVVKNKFNITLIPEVKIWR